MQAPLGRAVIGGLVASTFATLLILPSVFAAVIGRKVSTSPSIYPGDPHSSHFDPKLDEPFGEEAHHEEKHNADSHPSASRSATQESTPSAGDSKPPAGPSSPNNHGHS
jgi:hypothetical protein